MSDVHDIELFDRTLQTLKDRKKRIDDGGVNCIPTPFKRFENDFCGIEQGTYYCITSFTKGAKSQFVSYTFIFRTIVYSYFAKEQIDFKIIYFPLEETKERIMQRFMSWLLFKKSKGVIRISPKDLRSTVRAVNENILDRIEQFDIQNLCKYFSEHVIFPTEKPNPTGIYKYCKQYAEDHGTVHKKTVKIKDDLGVLQEVESFDYYEQDNPNEYRMVIIDTINLIDTEKGMTLKQSIDKLSEYLAKDLRNKYHFSPVVIQQQSTEAENNEAFKQGRVRPSSRSLGDSKYTSHDANIVLGLFSPAKFDMKEYMGYDINILRDHIRFLEVIVNRDGEMGGIIPLWFDGAVCDFKELPKSEMYSDATPNDKIALDKIYSLCRTLKATGQYPQPQPVQKHALLFRASNYVKHLINYNF